MAPRPALGRSKVVNFEVLEKIRLVVVAAANEWVGGLPRSGQVHGLGIHVLHLDTSSLVLLSSFTFLCKAFVGVSPSMALLRHFFSLELVSKKQCSGCVTP
ncbi:hypothetical protein D1007_09251 [Hordeum vulgare]|nr:hypothetical protein D1007_09251 [Hordeum vulgare]